MRKTLLFIIIIFIVSISCKKEGCNCNKKDENLKRIYILNTGDIHEMSYFLPKVAHFIKQFRKEHENVLVFDAGDRFTWWPTYGFNYENGTNDTVLTDLKSLHTNGKAILDVLDMIGYDAMIFGNHSWVYTIDTLLMRINEYQLPILSCNIIFPANIPSKSSKVFSFGDINIGVLGVTTGNKDHVQPGDSLDVGSPTGQYVVNEINTLQNSSDLVVMLTHEPDQSDELSIYTLQGFDVLIGGHSHNAMNNWIIGRLMTKAGLGGMYVGVTEIIWDTEKDKLSGFDYYIKYMVDYPYEDEEVRGFIDGLKRQITSYNVHISERFQCGNHRRILASSFSPTGRERSPKSAPQHAPTVTNKAEKTDMQRISAIIDAQYATINFKMCQIKTILVANIKTNE